MKFLLITILMFVLAGCATTYDAERTNPDGTLTKLMVKSYREFPGGIEIVYNRETGQFELKAGEVTNGMEGFSEVLLKMIPLIQPVAPQRIVVPSLNIPRGQ